MSVGGVQGSERNERGGRPGVYFLANGVSVATGVLLSRESVKAPCFRVCRPRGAPTTRGPIFTERAASGTPSLAKIVVRVRSDSAGGMDAGLTSCHASIPEGGSHPAGSARSRLKLNPARLGLVRGGAVGWSLALDGRDVG